MARSHLVLTVALMLVSVLSAQALQHPLPDEMIHRASFNHSKSLRSDPLGVEGYESSFRTINRRNLLNCLNLNPYVKMTIDTAGPLSDTQVVTVNVSGVVNPSDHDFIAVMSPSNASTKNCPDVALLILATGDLSELPLVCHYPVKFKLLKDDPGYLTCASSGLQVPCVVDKAGPLPFANPKAPLYGHISSIDSSGTSMRLTWVSGDAAPQTVLYANGSRATSTVSSFTKGNMCAPSAAADFGWHDPGYIHTAVMAGLTPSTEYSYQYGSQTTGLSPITPFSTPPAAGDDMVTLIIFGDMGKAERDGSSIHYIQPGSISVIDAITTVVTGSNVDFVFHIGDISYATGFLVEWDNFLELIQPVASRVPYMTAIGNHERDHPFSGSYYGGTDSGGECGIPYYNYFQMPTPAQDKPWYSLESGPIHFTVVSTEHDWKVGSEQYLWIQADLASVNRTRTPWVVYTGHRPMYSSYDSAYSEILPAVDTEYTDAIEPLLLAGKVDLVLAGHVHNYERLCAVYQSNCLLNSTKDIAGLDTYDFTTYAAPVQAVIGMSGFELDGFKSEVDVWSKVRISEFGYVGIQATRQRLLFEFMFVNMTVGDSFAIVK